MDYAIVSVPAAAIRKKPDHRKEMTNQLLFGEAVKVLKIKKGKWAKVKSLHDGYEGWVTMSLLQETDEETAATRSAHITADMFTPLRSGQVSLLVPFGSSLPAYTENQTRINQQVYQVEGNVLNRTTIQAGAVSLDQLVQPWLNAPYLWGGRTAMGVDCSGFIQVLFKTLGIDLPRDAWQQAQEGEPVAALHLGRAGDLVFFDDKEEIVHVGLLLKPELVVHAAGKVRIDPIDKKGIINRDSGQRTHRLKAIRRYW